GEGGTGEVGAPEVGLFEEGAGEVDVLEERLGELERGRVAEAVEAADVAREAEGGVGGVPAEEVLDLLAVAAGAEAALALPLEPEDEPPDDEEVEHHPVRLGGEVLQEAGGVAEVERERGRDDDGGGTEENVEREADGVLGGHPLQPRAEAGEA